VVCAKGELKEAIDDKDNKVEALITWLCGKVSFGALDVCYQRAALVID
jgi:hypothetical protein